MRTTKMKKTCLITVILLGASLLAGGCSDFPQGVNIEQKDGYYAVVMDYSGRSHREMGQALALKILQTVPEYSSTIDAMMALQFKLLEQVPLSFTEVLTRAKAILQNVPQEYVEEIQGMQQVFYYNVDKLGDGILSANELLVLQLFPDTLRPTGCSASAAFGSASATGKTVLGRNLDWYTVTRDAAAKVQSVTTMKNGATTTVNVSVLGMLSASSQFNQDKVFGAVLDAEVPTKPYPTDLTQKRSYVFDLRYALENYQTLDEVADFMKSQDYAFNHLIFLADETSAVVVENNIDSPGRGVRLSTSTLRSGLTWGITDAVATVNDFRLPDNFYNPDDAFNTQRWGSFQDLYTSALDGAVIGLDEMKDIAGYHAQDGDAEHGAIFLSSTSPDHYTTIQSIIVSMDTLELWVHFTPTSGPAPLAASYRQVAHALEDLPAQGGGSD